jgi:hypothetical protein
MNCRTEGTKKNRRIGRLHEKHRQNGIKDPARETNHATSWKEKSGRHSGQNRDLLLSSGTNNRPAAATEEEANRSDRKQRAGYRARAENERG